jgi:hypothetical protein
MGLSLFPYLAVNAYDLKLFVWTGKAEQHCCQQRNTATPPEAMNIQNRAETQK